MSVLSQLNELLERIPVWKQLVGLPARVRAIEEKLGMAPSDDRPICLYCRLGRLDLIKSSPDPTFRHLGITRDTLRCDNASCAKTDFRRHERRKV